LLGKLRKMRLLADDDDDVAATSTSKSGSAQPAWMRQLYEKCKEWMSQLPEVSGFSYVKRLKGN